MKGGDSVSAIVKSLRLLKKIEAKQNNPKKNRQIEKAIAFSKAEKKIKEVRENILAKLHAESGRWWI